MKQIYTDDKEKKLTIFVGVAKQYKHISKPARAGDRIIAKRIRLQI